MKCNDNIPIDFWRECLSYDAENGVLYWKTRPLEHFMTSQSCATWNKRFAGKPAGSPNNQQYIHIGMRNKLYKAHRIVWALYYGEYPHSLIDHVNGNRQDNRIENLRVVSSSENCQNQKLRITSTSGCVGVAKCNSGFRSYIQVNGKRVHLGVYQSVEEAFAVRKEAESRYGYHENHGRK
ncbi:HNH endonuclease [Klebsiella pneumoniae]|uniref:HNH endonuclease signature motif containing protein n=2 Tax=Klebsiella/Raoultella group TaxID=2890311 RepID=UPI000907CAEF|nr:HNH endonuclease [Klebsiella pneumoniae]VTO56221.1 HNH endonuclease [Klebsiella variicola]HAI9497779.1 HNH endonuclease [Escherichia coli]EKK0500961.1 HNH endonuclease [Klebsiella pneumoniae]EKS0527671.1 HNH endonuclease [Klebsiella pneumoniae]